MTNRLKMFFAALAALFVMAQTPSVQAQNEQQLNAIASRRSLAGLRLDMNPAWLAAPANSCPRWQMAAQASATEAATNGASCSAAAADAQVASEGVTSVCGVAMANLQTQLNQCLATQGPASPTRGPRLAQIPRCHPELGGATLLYVTRDGRELRTEEELASVTRAQIRSATCECPRGGVATRFAVGSRNVYCGMPYRDIVIAPPGANNPVVETDTTAFNDRVTVLETRIDQVCTHNVPAPVAPGSPPAPPLEPGQTPPSVVSTDCEDMMLRLWQLVTRNAAGAPTDLGPLTTRVTALETRMTTAESNIDRLDRRINVDLTATGFGQVRFNGHNSFGTLLNVRLELGLVDRLRIYVEGGGGYALFNGAGNPTTGLYGFSGGMRLIVSRPFSLTIGFRHLVYAASGTQSANEPAPGDYRGNYWGGEFGGRYAFTDNWALLFAVGFGQTSSVMVSAPTSVHNGSAIETTALSTFFTLGVAWRPL